MRKFTKTPTIVNQNVFLKNVDVKMWEKKNCVQLRMFMYILDIFEQYITKLKLEANQCSHHPIFLLKCVFLNLVFAQLGVEDYLEYYYTVAHY